MVSTGCSAGVFTAHAAVELYAKAFDSVGCIEKLEVRVLVLGVCCLLLSTSTRVFVCFGSCLQRAYALCLLTLDY